MRLGAGDPHVVLPGTLGGYNHRQYDWPSRKCTVPLAAHAIQLISRTQAGKAVEQHSLR